MTILEDPAIIKKYGNKWLALTDNEEIVCSASSLEKVLARSEKNGVSDPITLLVPDFRCEFIL